MAIFALHVHIKMDLVLADLRRARMAFQAVLILRLYLARRMRFMTFVAVELHGRGFGELDLDRFFHERWVRHEETHVHGTVGDQLLPDALIVAVAVEAFFSSGFEVLRAIGVTVDAG